MVYFCNLNNTLYKIYDYKNNRTLFINELGKEVLNFPTTSEPQYSKRLGNVKFIEEQISGKANFKKRQLGILLEQLNKGDVLIVSELSRIARSITQIFEVIEITKQKEIILYSLKENFCNCDKSIRLYIFTK